jgi:hypothetical protein
VLRAGPSPIISSRVGRLWAACPRACGVLGFGQAMGGMRCPPAVLARVIEPVGKLDSLRVLEETGIEPLAVTVRDHLAGIEAVSVILG